MKACTSCKTSTANDNESISIACPICNSEIIRCGKCRKTAVAYKCNCGFEGP